MKAKNELVWMFNYGFYSPSFPPYKPTHMQNVIELLWKMTGSSLGIRIAVHGVRTYNYYYNKYTDGL